MTISGEEVFRILRHRYPNARIFVLDELYEVPTRERVTEHYQKFQRSLKFNKLLRWTKSIWDCDDFAWAFKGGVNAHKAMKGDRLPLPIGWMIYEDQQAGWHSINDTIFAYQNGSMIREIEPQSNGGINNLSLAERKTATVVIM